MAELLSTLSIISFVLAGICLVLAVALCILFKIPMVIGDLSGRNAKKSIARMRAANEKSGNKSHKESKVNANRPKITSTMPQATAGNVEPEGPVTDVLSENKGQYQEQEATTLLESDDTQLLNDPDETTLLTESAPIVEIRTPKVRVQLLEEVMLIHTDEVIG